MSDYTDEGAEDAPGDGDETVDLDADLDAADGTDPNEPLADPDDEGEGAEVDAEADDLTDEPVDVGPPPVHPQSTDDERRARVQFERMVNEEAEAFGRSAHDAYIAARLAGKGIAIAVDDE